MEKLSSIKNWLNAGGSRRKWTVGLFAISILITGVIFISSGSPAPAYGAVEPAPLYFVGIFAKLVAVLLLIIGGAIFLRRWQVKSGLHRTGSLSVIETVRLSPKQAVHLVRVGNQHLLIGATDQTISMLAAVEAPQAELQSAPQTRPAQGQPELEQPQQSFMQVLQSLTFGQATSSQPAPVHASDESKE